MSERVIDTLKKIVKDMESNQEFERSFDYIIELRSYSRNQWSYAVQRKGQLIAGGSGCNYQRALDKIEEAKTREHDHKN